MRTQTRKLTNTSVLRLITYLLLIAGPSVAFAQNYQQPKPLLVPLGNWCPFGTCDIAMPVYVNVYWDSSFAQWDADITSAGADMTVDRIDTLTGSIVQAQYFSLLSPYSVTTASLLPSIAATNCGPPPATINGAISQLSAFAGCVLQNNPQINPSIAILNVLLPPQTGALSPTTDFCHFTNGTHTTAEHDLFGSPVEMTLIPTNGTCNSSVGALFRSMTHEMVEAATDPNPQSPTGWKVPWDGITDFGDEIADICEGEPNSQASNLPSSGASQVSQQAFLYGTMSTFFAGTNLGPVMAGNCVPIPPLNILTFTTNGTTASPFGPQITSATVCGAGSSMAMGARVTNIGRVPWDLPAPGASGSTVYFNMGISESNGNTWSAGNIHGSPPDLISFGSMTWSSQDASGNSVINAFGFTSPYGSTIGGSSAPAVVEPGDTITLNIFDTNLGQRLAIGLTTENPNAINGLRVVGPPYVISGSGPQPENSTQWYFAGTSGLIPGNVVGSPNCGAGILPAGEYGMQGVPLVLTSSDANDSVTPVSPTTNNNGFFEFGYLPRLAGTKIITASVPHTSVTANTTVNVHPNISGIHPNGGPIGGQQSVTITGMGYVEGQTTASFNGPGADEIAAATDVAVASSTTVNFTTPASPLGQNCSTATATSSCVGQVDVAVSVGGQNSLPVTYNYFVQGRPQITLIPWGCYPTDGALLIEVYDSNGDETNTVVNLTATAAIFQSGATATMQAGGRIPLLPGKGIVTITASTGSGSTAQSTTETFSYSTPDFCRPNEGPWESENVSNQLPQSGLETDQALTPQRDQRTGNNVVWSDPSEAGNFVQIRTLEKTSAKEFRVTSLSVYDLRSLIRTSQAIFVRKGHDSRVMQFTGTGIRIMEIETGEEKPATANRSLSGTALLSFALPASATPIADYRILHRSSMFGVGVWEELKALPAARHNGRAVRANIGQSGVYALAVLQGR